MCELDSSGMYIGNAIEHLGSRDFVHGVRMRARTSGWLPIIPQPLLMEHVVEGHTGPLQNNIYVIFSCTS